MQAEVAQYNTEQNVSSYLGNTTPSFNSTRATKMPKLNVFQPHKQQKTATQAPLPDDKVKSQPARPNTLLPSKYKVLDDSFLFPDSDEDADIGVESDDYELTDDELLDYGRPGRRQAAKKQGLVFVSPEVERSLNGKGTKQSANELQENEVTLSLKDKTNVTQKKPGFLRGSKK